MQHVIVTGMHRSGTSVVARMCQLIGVDLGPEHALMQGGPENPDGFFEHRWIKEINEQVLERLGGTWQSPPRLPPGWQDSALLTDLRSQAATALADLERAADGPLVGFKDPRACLTLDLWKPLACEPRVVVVVRDPSEVAASLDTRDGLPHEAGIDLWNRYTTSVLDSAPDAHIVIHSRIFKEPDEVIRTLAQVLGLPADAARVTSAIEAIRPELRRSSGSPLGDGAASRFAAWLFEELRAGRRPAPAVLAALHEAWNGREARPTEQSLLPALTGTTAREPAERVEPLRGSGSRAAMARDLDEAEQHRRRLWYDLEHHHARIIRRSDDLISGEDDPDRHFPTFVLIGAQYTRIRWLRDHLVEHPDVAVTSDATRFFDRHFGRGLAWYREQLAETVGARARGEYGPSYLDWRYGPARTAARLDGVLPDVRLLAVLCDPVERAFRAFVRHRRAGRIADDHDLVAYVETTHPDGDAHGLIAGGSYGRSLGPYVERFGERLLVVTEEELERDPDGYRSRCLHHVGVAADHLRPVPRPKLRLESERLSRGDRATLLHRFRDDLAELAELTDIDVEAWIRR